MKKFSLYRKLMLSFFMIILISLLCAGVFTYLSASKELDVLAESHMEQIVSNIVHQTDLYLKAYERSIVSLLASREIKQLIDLPEERPEYDFYKLRSLIRDEYAYPSFVRQPDIAVIYIISNHNNAVYYYNKVPEEAFFDQRESREQLLRIRSLTDESGSLSILNSSILEDQQHKLLTLVRQIRGLSSLDSQGILGIEFRAEELSALWEGVDLGEEGHFYIVDKNGYFIYHPDAGQVGQPAPDAITSQLANAGPSLFDAESQGQKRMYMAERSDYSDWHLIASMPVKELRKPVEDIRTVMLVVGAFTFLFAFILAYRFARSITGPVSTLMNGMKQTERGKWEMIPLPDHRDEIVELMIRYNLMVNRLSELVEEVYQADMKNQVIQMERQQAQLQSLQLQINPHFLYNTLETINCYASIQNSEEISEIVKSLAFMLRYSVQTDLEEITVANELMHVVHYMNVLQFRIDRPFEIVEVLDSRFLLYKMVRLTLQPLVENIFQHAFPDGIEDYHSIRIDAGETEDAFWISVEDNGCGMKPEKLQQLKEKLERNRLAEQSENEAGRKGGIGLLNVHRRIQMVFGERYGLTIESEWEMGTKMIMIMPLSPEAPALSNR
ncbi:histidine kinase [Paenibacillus sp. J5C_2022]|uniref:cache domain-containing sensor histidine kinase n=1 Tax=Paenibacillus sp. J5C2022 TaxID=2977129 RepID=UPI0021CF7149|nr:sensor histidine kinase [Paenibacillus sp. J5C2022]MCU6707529.1 histidine kinase [Paenibacillus sp. J5C2022]